MSVFKAVVPNVAILDPHKRVNYTPGLVLGVDEFMQEQLYLLNKDRSHNRSLHGYGTVYGLKVTVQDKDGSPEVKISAGLAIDPLGREIRLPLEHCAKLDDWLGREDIQARLAELLSGSPPALELGTPPKLSLYVVLCYRECQTDPVPIPGGPCQSLEDSSAASRITDAFELKLSFTPPKQSEELAVRLFGELLKRIEVVGEGGFLTEARLSHAVRGISELTEQLETDAAHGIPPTSKTIEELVDSLAEQITPVGPRRRIGPSEKLILPLQQEDANAVLNTAFRVWVTEVRPQVMAGKEGAGSNAGDEACLLLARLDLEVEEIDSKIQIIGNSGNVILDQSNRPYLIHTRLLQEVPCITNSLGGASL